MSKDKRPKSQRAAAKAYAAKRTAGLVPFKPGTSGNPGGRPRTHKEMVALLREHAPRFVEIMIDIAERGARGEQLTASDKILSNHIEFVWQAAFGRHAQSMLLAGGLDVGDNPYNLPDGGPFTALLQRASLENEKLVLSPLPAPVLSKLTAEERQISGLSVMLAQARASTPDGTTGTSRQVLENLVGKDRAVELIGEGVIVVDAAGTAVAPDPASATVTAAPAPSPVAEGPPEAAPAPPRDPGKEILDALMNEPELKPEPPYQGRDVSPPRLPKPKYSGMPADARAHFEARDRARQGSNDDLVRRQEEARAQGRPGGQIPMSELPPDPPERSMQGPPEYIRFTRIPGGRGIRRC